MARRRLVHGPRTVRRQPAAPYAPATIPAALTALRALPLRLHASISGHAVSSGIAQAWV